MNSKENLLSRFRPPGVRDDELLNLIATHFSSARGTSENDVLYPNSGDFALKVHSKAGRITSIARGPALTELTLQELTNKVQEELVASPGTIIWRGILFSSHPVKGCRRFGRQLQLLQSPSNAPQPPVLIADHPFVIEFPIAKSINGFATNARGNRSTIEWSRFLNAVLQPQIKTIGPRPRHLWVYCQEASDKSTMQGQVKWAQEFYMVDGFASQTESLSACDQPDIPETPASQYYTDRWHSDTTFVVPDNLALLIDAYANLSGDAKIKFARAIQWIYVANEHWTTHVSSFYIALVAALESLMPPSPSSERCPSCGKGKGPGVTDQFNTFVNDYIIYADNSSKKKLYKLRSDIAHGFGLLQIDANPRTFDTSSIDERAKLNEIATIAREVLIGWLLRQDNVRLANLPNGIRQ